MKFEVICCPENLADMNVNKHPLAGDPDQSLLTTQEAAQVTGDPFQVDTDAIRQVSVEEQGAELQGLGLTVFNQDELEQGIMEQVDDALAREEETRLRNILERELSSVNNDMVLAKRDLEKAVGIEAGMVNKGQQNKESQRQLDSIKKQKENKMKQLSTLTARFESLKKKLAKVGSQTMDAEDVQTGALEGAFMFKAVKSVKETERELLIRTGKMTPFGTFIKASSDLTDKLALPSDTRKRRPSESSVTQGSQRRLKLKTQRKESRRVMRTEKGGQPDDQQSQGSDNSENLNQQRKSKRAKMFRNKIASGEVDQHEDEVLDESDDVDDDDEDEYHPSLEEFQTQSSDDNYLSGHSDNSENSGKVSRKRSRGRKHFMNKRKPRPLPEYREHSDDEIEPGRSKVKRDSSIRRERDDADPEHYQQRLLRQQKLDEATEKQESSEDCQDAIFDGGLEVPQKLWLKLFGYQKTGVRWLWELHCQQAGGIVGDEMGLGKTIQTISFLAALRTSRVRNANFPYKGLGPTIIICPTTVMHQWLKEFHKWWPDFRVAILHSSGSFCGSESDLVRSIAKSQGILITSYNTLVIHQELVLRFNWHYVILDEGHKIRNPDAKITLCCKQFRTPHRIILSGSPIQNNLKELWSLFDFVFPGKLGTLPDFMQHFSIPIVQGGYSNASQTQVETAYKCACVLRDTINPYLLRRMKADVKKSLDLPNKNEQVLFCRLTEEQRDVYQEYLGSRECNAILQGKFQVFAGLITLRKICNHPDMCTGGPKNLQDGSEGQFGYYKRSGKMIVVEALLKLWHRQKHRVLLFTQSKAMLNILEKCVQDRGYTYLVMDGGTPIPARQPLITQYNNDSSIYLFLLTTRVGGLGVNLIGADRVIIYDPDWNPSTDIQARERAWRIGQTRQVTIYRLLTSGTIEEKIYHRQIFKQFLTNRVLKDPRQRRLFKSQDMLELFTLGSQENCEGTETSALFAGTGCDVEVPKKLRRRNRFDEMEEEKRQSQAAGNSFTNERKQQPELEDNKGIEDIEVDFDEGELQRMKEFARILSKKIGLEKNKRKTQCSSMEMQTEAFGTGNIKLEIFEVKDSKQGTTDLDNRRKSNELHPIEQRMNDQDVAKQEVTDLNETIPTAVDINDPELMETGVNDAVEKVTDIEPTKHLMTHKDENKSQRQVEHGHLTNDVEHGQINTKPPTWRKIEKRWTIPLIKRERCDTMENSHTNSATETMSHAAPTSNQRLPAVHHRKSHPSTGVEEHSKKTRRKKKPSDAKFEGERISHLVKHQQLPPTRSAAQEPDTHHDDQHHDDYVLRQLFKKTGVQSAMRHDKIMDSGRPDYVIVEAEAERVAREAASALRRSRLQCASALSGRPTWTGQHGGVVKPRFGQKKNDLVLDKSRESVAGTSFQGANSSQKAQSISEEKLFDGSISGNVSLSSKNSSLTSSDLLHRIRARKRLSATFTNECEDDDFLRPDIPTPRSVEPKDEELLQDIRNYVAFMASNSGEATTQEIILNFGQRLPKSDAPKFKAMLNQICDFHQGVWRLKQEFR